jgi:predicted P-loop ATPase
MADFIMQYDDELGVNIGTPLATFDAPGKRDQAHCRNVFGLFTEADNPDTQPVLPPNYTVASSPGHFHYVHFVPEGLHPGNAKQFAEAMKRATGAQGQGNIVNCVRVPGTRNSKYPNAPLVRVHKVPDGQVTSLDDLRHRLKDVWDAPPAAPVTPLEGDIPSVDDMISRCERLRDAGPGEWVDKKWTLDEAAYDGDAEDTPATLARKKQFGYFGRYEPYWKSIHAVRRAYNRDDALRIVEVFKDARPDKFKDNWQQPLTAAGRVPTIRTLIRASNDIDRAERRDDMNKAFTAAVANMPFAHKGLPPGAVSLMGARGAKHAELWGPLLATIPRVERTTAHPEMPATGHPLRDAINTAIPGIMATGNTEALAIIEVVHCHTAALVGTITPDVKARAAALEQDAENRSAIMSDYRRNLKNGEPERDNIDNIKFFLRSLNIEIRFNEWIEREEIRGWIYPDWRQLDDTAVSRLRMRASESTTRFLPGKEFTWDALLSLAHDNPVDPARDLLDLLQSQWDGVPRLATWLTKTCGVPDDAYHREVGKSMLRGLCARIRQPGCKYDLMTVFISERQGTSKSTLARVLALNTEWFAEDVSLGEASKELVLLLAGKTVVEISEMRTRGEANNVKAMVSRTHDEARTAYSRKTVKRPRRNIFVGSTNEPEFLEDQTGGRRFLPVTVRGEIDLEFVRSNLAQLVGEAATQHSKGCEINLPREIWDMAGEHQEAARITSGIEELLRDWYATPETDVFVPSAEIVRRLADERQSTSLKPVAPIMRSMGYMNHRTAEQRMWVKSATGKYHAGCKHVGKAQLLIAPPPAPGQPSLQLAQAPKPIPPPPY